MSVNAVRFIQRITSALVLAGLSSTAFAKKMDLETHNIVIERLESIVKNMDGDDTSKVPSTLRLADLYADRSRLKSVQEVEQNCNNCLKSKEDRRQALNYYKSIISKLDNNMRGPALLQKAHLHFALAEINEAEKIYKMINKEGKRRHKLDTIGQSHALLGDVYFQKAKFKDAKNEYQKALAISHTPNKGLVHYRMAWCLFNLDQISSATNKLEMILQTPRLTEMNNGEGTVQDESFKIDVSKDLATFYARKKITRSTVNRLTQLSPPAQRQQNLFFLATEADRLGKKREAALVWVIYLNSSEMDKEVLEAQIRLMKLKRDMGDLKGALITFDNVKTIWDKRGCEDKCDKLQAQIRKWIIDWNREEKKHLTPELTQAYISYTQLFPKDEEMYMWGAGVAQELKQYTQAFQLFRQAAEVSLDNLNRTKDEDKAQKKKLRQVFEGALIGEIDMAETIKDHNVRISAYNHYLKLNSHGSRQFEVRYQLAQVEFEKKDFVKAGSMFRVLALEKIKAKNNLQKTSADMAIDSLIQAKDEETIQKWSLEFAQKFPKNKNQYLVIHRKSVLNVTAIKINNRSADNTDLIKLKSVSLVESTPLERTSLYKNTYLLAIQLENFSEAKRANQYLLSLKDLSSKEKDEAIQNRIWLAELEFDFATAYNLSKNQDHRMTETRALKLYWLAVMAGRNPDKHAKDFLARSHNRQLRATVIVNQVQRQVHQTKALKPYLKELSKSPEVLARLSLEIYGKGLKKDALEQAYKYKSVRNTSTGSIIHRLLVYDDLNKDMSKLGKSRINSRSDSALASSLKERIKLLQVVEKHGQQAIKDRDIVLQAITLNTLRSENQRLYNDLLKLPTPKGLNPQQKEQYSQLLAQQAQPYKIKADQLEQKLQDLWKNDDWAKQIANNYVQARYEYKPALKKDIEQLSKHAPSSDKKMFVHALTEPHKLPSDKVVAKVQKQIRKQPFKVDYVEELKDLETKRGNDFIVSHLEARLMQMKGALK